MISDATRTCAALVDTVASVYRGPRRAVELAAVAFLARGHVLIEDVPGVGKTTLARAFAAATGGSFRRLQGTPDLMPADVTGVSVWEERERSFRFHPGPVFADVLLADELNRTPPRTQSALLEALAEGRVTVDGEQRPLPSAFFCLATQNPLDHAGTYPLPDSQRDRFLISLRPGYPEAAQEMAMLAADGAERPLAAVRPALGPGGGAALREAAASVRVDDSIRRYVVELARASRGHRAFVHGASPRAALGLQRAAQAHALMAGRDFVIPDDVQAMAVCCLAHRTVTRAGQAPEPAVAALVEQVAVPR